MIQDDPVVIGETEDNNGYYLLMPDGEIIEAMLIENMEVIENANIQELH